MNEPEIRLSNRDVRLLRRILEGRSDANIRFSEFRRLLRNMGFVERIRGSHHTYKRPGLRSFPIQPEGSLAKPYQIGRFRALVLRKGLIPNDS